MSDVRVFEVVRRMRDICRQYASSELSMAKALPKIPKGTTRGSIYTEKVITGGGHGLAAWESN